MRRGVWQWFRFTLFEPKQFAGTVSALLLTVTLAAVVAGYPVRFASPKPAGSAQQYAGTPIGRGALPSDAVPLPTTSAGTPARLAGARPPTAAEQAVSAATVSAPIRVAGSTTSRSQTKKPGAPRPPRPTPAPTPTIQVPAPIAVLTTNVSGMTVSASGAASSSPQGLAIVSYAFDFGDGAILGPQPIEAVTHLYGVAGTYTVTLTVTDARGRTGTDRVRVEVS